MARPVIGICTPLERARWGAWDLDAFLLPRSYVDAVHRAGGDGAAAARPTRALVEDPDEVLDRIDGLMLAGGADVDPQAYGADAAPGDDRQRPRARRLRGRARAARARARPAAARHLPRDADHERRLRRHAAPAPARAVRATRSTGACWAASTAPTTTCAWQPGSLAARAAGEELHATKSHHHQGVDRVGEGLEVTGWAVVDDLPEALELPGNGFALGVQWHPEADETSRLIARARRARRATRVG